MIIPTVYSYLYINEVNYDPEGNDNNQEYIELYTDLDLTNYIVKDLVSEDILEKIKTSNSNYSLIVEEGFNYTNIEANIYSVGTTIGNNLNNEEDLIIILNNQTILDTLHYFSEWGANNNEKSLCKIKNIWSECDPTPGYDNSDKITLNIPELEITEFLPDPQGNDSGAMPNGEFIEIYNPTENDYDLTGYKIKDKANREIIISSTSTYEQVIKEKSYLVIYLNGQYEGFLNNEGLEEFELLTQDEIQIDKVVYSSSKEGDSWSKINNIWYLTKPTPNEKNPEDSEQDKESKISIEEVYLGEDRTAKFGDNIRIKLNIYKGDESKESISVYIQKDNKKISKTTSFNIHEKYSNNIITVPVQIIPNCNLNSPEGDYIIYVEGLDTNTERDIELKGITENLCEKEKIECTEENVVTTLDNSLSENVINSQLTTNPIIYESKSKKTERTGIYFFSFILVLLLIHLIAEKWKK